MFPISGSLSELGLSEFSPSLSLQGRERRGRRRKKRRSRGGDGEVKEGGYKYARRRTDETSADRGTELGRQGEVSAQPWTGAQLSSLLSLSFRVQTANSPHVLSMDSLVASYTIARM